MAALWEADLHSERMTGKEVCELSAVTVQKLAEAGPETDPQGNPEGSLSEGEACVRGQAVVDVAWEAWVHDVGWAMIGVGLGDQEAEPEVNVEREAFADGGMLLTG